MLRPAQKHGQAISQGLPGKVFLRYGVVPFQPLFGPELFKGREELLVDIRPGASQSGRLQRVLRKGPVGVVDKSFVELGVQPIAETQQWKQPIVHGGEMPEQIVDPVSARRDLALKVFVAERSQGLINLGNALLLCT
jgi:hypothetical protein